MNNKNLLKQAIEDLKQLQLELHDTLDSGKKAELEKIIQELEKCQNPKNDDILKVIGEVLIIVFRFILFNEGSELLEELWWQINNKD